MAPCKVEVTVCATGSSLERSGRPILSDGDRLILLAVVRSPNHDIDIPRREGQLKSHHWRRSSQNYRRTAP